MFWELKEIVKKIIVISEPLKQNGYEVVMHFCTMLMDEWNFLSKFTYSTQCIKNLADW